MEYSQKIKIFRQFGASALLLALFTFLCSCNSSESNGDTASCSGGCESEIPEVDETVTLSEIYYFAGNNGEHGYEVWRTDGTSAGTYRLTDVNTTGHSYPRSFTAVGESVYFVANNGERSDLWRIDVASGEYTNITNDIGSAAYSRLTVVRDCLYFVVRNNERNLELWRIDDSSGVREMLATFEHGNYPVNMQATDNALFLLLSMGMEANSLGNLYSYQFAAEELVLLSEQVGFVANGDEYSDMVVVDNQLYFHVFPSYAGADNHWVSDGTLDGTRALQPHYCFPQSLYAADNMAFSESHCTDEGQALYVIEGGSDEVLFLESFAPVGEIADFVYGDGVAYFSTNTRQLWKSDGTPEGTEMIVDLADQGYVRDLTLFQGSLYFVVGGGKAIIWKSDGTEDGTEPFKDISAPGERWNDIFDLVNQGELLLFRANDGVHGLELWRCDGSPEGTRIIKDINRSAGSSPRYLTDVNGTLYFHADGQSLWRSGSPGNGSGQVEQLQFWQWGLSQVLGLYAFQDSLYFIGDGPVPGADHNFPRTQLWHLENSSNTPSFVDVVSESGFSSRWPIFSSDYYFYYGTNVDQYNLWRADNASGESLLMSSRRSGWFPGAFAVGPYLLLGQSDNEGQRVVSSDGENMSVIIAGGTLNDSYSSSSYEKRNTYLNNDLFFFSGGTLWSSDGTAENTIARGELVGSGGHLTATSDDVYFIVNYSQLWASAGGTDPAELVAECPGDISQLTAGGELLFFVVDDPEYGKEIWVSNGTAAGTYMVDNINPSGGSDPQYLVYYGGELFFSADDGTHGRELWKASGGQGEAELVKDILPIGSHSAEPMFLTVSGDRLYFSADDLKHGREVWVTDGSEEGTMIFIDIAASRADGVMRVGE